MDFKQLRSFVAVAESLSFTRAAERLYTTQPTVSAHVRALEEELHVCLLLRTTKSMQITPQGRELYEYAVHTLAHQEALVSRWSRSENTIYLGASTIPSAYILPELLPHYRQQQPDIRFSIHQSDSRAIIEGITDGRLELGFVGMKEEESAVSFTPFCRDRSVLITPNNEHFRAMQAQGVSPVELLLREPVILREQGSGSRRTIDNILREADLDNGALHVTAWLNDQESVKNLVAGGLGISMISELAARNHLEAGRLLSFPLPFSSATRYLYLVQQQGDYTRPQVKKFIAFAEMNYSRTEAAQ